MMGGSRRALFLSDQALAATLSLAEGLAASVSVDLRWMWGEALLAYAMAEFGAFLEPEDPRASPCFRYAEAVCSSWARRPRRVDQSDTAAPALALWAVKSRVGGAAWDGLLDQALAYLRFEPRLLADIPNHLGHSFLGRLYPKSVWVDSLVMLGLFPALYGGAVGDEVLLGWASSLPGRFASLLQDPGTGLWRHAYWAKGGGRSPRAEEPGRTKARGAFGAGGPSIVSGVPYPRVPIFWARGNGWVLRALAILLEVLPRDRPERAEILEVFRKTSAALLPLARPDGWFPTVLGRPTYRESSATLLVAGGWMRGLAHGWLAEQFRLPALRSFESVVASIRPARGGGLELAEISGPTIPLPLFPFLGYALVPRGANRPYGVAALLLAALDRAELLGA